MDTFQTPNDQNDGAPNPDERYVALVEGPSSIPNDVLLRKVRNGGFSWCTFLIGPFYWAYRKCYAETAALVLFNLAASLLPNSPLWLVLSLATSVVLGFAFPYLYRWRADRLYARALAQGAANDRAALEYVRSRGGASWQGVVALVAAAFTIAFLELLVTGAFVTTTSTVSTF